MLLSLACLALLAGRKSWLRTVGCPGYCFVIDDSDGLSGAFAKSVADCKWLASPPEAKQAFEKAGTNLANAPLKGSKLRSPKRFTPTIAYQHNVSVRVLITPLTHVLCYNCYRGEVQIGRASCR